MRRTVEILLAAPLCLILAGALYFLGLQATNNFHTVLPGELYRSAQLSGEDIRHYSQRYHIRSILNLRGPNPELEWYKDEVAAAKEQGIELIDIPILSRKKLTPQQTQELVDIMKRAPKPLLVHCGAGANRTGMASAVYLAEVKGVSKKEARLQLSPIYGHVPFTFLRAYPMRETMDAALANSSTEFHP